MIQFNLLPDVKLEYIKARRTKRLVLMASTIVTGVSLAILVVLFIGVNVLQKQHLNNLTQDIETDSKKFQEIEGLDRILTVQNQLNSLNDLHSKKPVASRLGAYFAQLIPNQITVETLEVDFDGTTMSFEGAGSGVDAVNKFIDTLKFTTFEKTVDGKTEEVNAFSAVVLEEFSRDEKKATYKITVKFDTLIFDSANEVKLKIPNRITTRSAEEAPENTQPEAPSPEEFFEDSSDTEEQFEEEAL